MEELTLEFVAATDQFIEAATDGRANRAERLLALHPGIAHANFHTALVVGDAETVERQLAEDPRRALERGGPRGWEPLHYVCYTSIGARAETRETGLVAIARRLIALGADPNLRFPWRHHEVERPVLWGAVFVVRSLPLATAGTRDTGVAATSVSVQRRYSCSNRAGSTPTRGRGLAE